MKVGGHVKFASCTLLLFVLVPMTSAKHEKELYCGACLGLVDEITFEIDKVNPKKKVQVGSYRVDSKGNQDLKQVPYARSEVHITELFYRICKNMNNYAESKTDSGDKTYVRFQSHDGSSMSIGAISIDGNTHHRLESSCQSLIGRYDDEMLPIFMDNEKNPHKKICIKLTGACTDKMVKARWKAMGKGGNKEEL